MNSWNEPFNPRRNRLNRCIDLQDGLQWMLATLADVEEAATVRRLAERMQKHLVEMRRFRSDLAQLKERLEG